MRYDLLPIHFRSTSCSLPVWLIFQVNRVLNDYVCLEREVATHQLDMNGQTASQMAALKNTWLQLSLEVRQLATPGHTFDLGGHGGHGGHVKHETSVSASPVSYTHLTLPTIYSV